jgi:hypothetical protein
LYQAAHEWRRVYLPGEGSHVGGKGGRGGLACAGWLWYLFWDSRQELVAVRPCHAIPGKARETDRQTALNE